MGKEAFGFVWQACRLSDGQKVVVVKFIRKGRIVSDCLVDDPMLGRVCQEIAILTRLQHHNIVKVKRQHFSHPLCVFPSHFINGSVWEVFENESYFQMVMEKHGEGLQTVAYLRNKGIFHRDIKDKNIIINTEFHPEVL
ncbi:PAS domain-containing serine/threonine-protein kinase-like [Oncorhynchus nerka]|uniref:PAS domain-containing serine/threonine-protein kinase-like n=1 Tax=Oncorhynchus nerka TaxID=8023 RepID=UPI001132515D|nr:PAS domain-containing serine/threonine-protein kinase-like [Oncorhynchus nerka]